MAVRSDVGADIVRRWARHLPPGGAVVDIGCGSGAPIAQALVNAGLTVAGIDPSPTLLAAFHARFPDAAAACEPAETSRFFGRRFDGAVAISLFFLLPEDTQLTLIHRVAAALNPAGRFLFTAPREACEWEDRLTGRRSVSLGMAGYEAALGGAGMRLVGSHRDAGGNHYFDAVAMPAVSG